MIILGQRTKHGDKERIQQRRAEESFCWHLLFILHKATCSLRAAPARETRNICAEWAKGSSCSNTFISIISGARVNRGKRFAAALRPPRDLTAERCSILMPPFFLGPAPAHQRQQDGLLRLLGFNFFQHSKNEDDQNRCDFSMRYLSMCLFSS